MKFLRQIWKAPDLRNSLLFVLAMLVVYRIAAHIPVPGVDPTNLRAFFAQNQILGLLNTFSGGSFDHFSVVALGVGPYITASIIFQLLAMIFPKLEEMQKEGEQGQQRINQYTRIATVPLAMLQAYAMINLLRQSQQPIIGALTTLDYAGILITMTAGTMLLMWLGELISERKIGNGVSILIFAGIVSRLPTAVQQAALAGVIPIIFAVSVILLPSMVGQLLIHAKTAWIASAAQKTIVLLQDQLVYGISFFLLVFLFTYFYTSVVFHPDRVAENLQKQGGYIPGIRPGRPTAEYLTKTVNLITPAGAFFLAVIAVLPVAIQNLTGSKSLVVGGTSMLIVVSVVIEIVKQIQAQLTMREYESL